MIGEDMVERAAAVVTPFAFSKDEDGNYWCADSAREIARFRATKILTAALGGSSGGAAVPTRADIDGAAMRDVLHRALAFYGALDREHDPGEAELLDSMTAVLVVQYPRASIANTAPVSRQARSCTYPACECGDGIHVCPEATSENTRPQDKPHV